MYETNNYGSTDYYDEQDYRIYIRKTFVQMFIGLLVTAGFAAWGFFSVINGGLAYRILVSSPVSAYLLAAIELVIVIALSAGLMKMSVNTAKTLFYVYAGINGLTFALLPIIYGVGEIFLAFLFAAVFFGCMAYAGYKTERDLSRFGNILLIGLFALVLMNIVMLFIHTPQLDRIVCSVGLLLFIGITAVDMQKIKQMFMNYSSDPEYSGRLSVYAALELYLDFINIFLRVLRILGNSRRNNN